MRNPKDFKRGDFVMSVYSLKIYEVIEPDKKGMAKLKQMNLNRAEDWNAYNNPHFKIFEGQLKLAL